MVSNIRLNVRWPVMFRLFVVSYAPLWAMFAARLSPHWWWVGGFLLLAAWGLAESGSLAKRSRGGSVYNTRITEVEDQGSAVAGYLATYLLPFLGSLPSKPGDVIAYLIYAGVALVVFAKSDLALINPTLYLFGWKVQRVVADTRSFIMLSREDVRADDVVAVRRIMGDVLLSARDVAR